MSTGNVRTLSVARQGTPSLISTHFSFMGGFVLAGIAVAFLAGLGSLFLDLRAL